MKRTWSFGILTRLFSPRLSPENSDNAADFASSSDGGPNHLDFADAPAPGVECLEKAAETGDPVAQNRFGLTLFAGSGLLQNDEQARKWLRRAAEQGYAEAQFNLGKLYQSASLRHATTQGGDARIEAYVWFHLAAAQGHAQAAASCELVNLQLTDAELAEGNRRAHGFECKKEVPKEQIHLKI